ncbi:MAG TPA: RsiV family protein, partial [Pyrinomonadaceae bacterium]
VVQQPIEFTVAVRVTPKVIKEANKEKLYTVDAEYPQIEGDPRFDSFNREARALITKDVAAFKTGQTVEENNPGEVLADEARESTLDIGYEIRCATDDLISVEFSEGTYEAGAAHGNSATTVVNYDVRNGKKLALADLFNPKSNYLTVISAYCIKELKDRSKKENDSMLSDDLIQSGASPRADNYRAWSITKKGLWITFDPYQVAAYAAGPQNVLVPYSALKDIIKPDGPVAAFAK